MNGQICYESNLYSFCVHEISQLIDEFFIVIFPHLFQLKYQKFQKLKLFFLNLGSGSQMMLPVTLQLAMNCSVFHFSFRPPTNSRWKACCPDAKTWWSRPLPCPTLPTSSARPSSTTDRDWRTSASSSSAKTSKSWRKPTTGKISASLLKSYSTTQFKTI